MPTHTCHVDCRLEVTPYTDGNGKPRERRAHIMYAAEPSSAAGRYQWEQNRAILDQGRRAWRASGQGQSRACRSWDLWRREILADLVDLSAVPDDVRDANPRMAGRY